MSCTDTSPVIYPSGATASLYYTSSGTCKDAAGGGVATVRFEIPNSSAISTVSVSFAPETTGLDVPTESFTKCSGEGTGNHSRDSYTNANFTMAFPVPPTGDNTWGWDFGNDDLPPKIRVKILVRRM